MQRWVQTLIKQGILIICTILFIVNISLRSQALNSNSVDTIMGGDYVVTMNQEQPVIRNGAVAIKDGKIVAVGTQNQIASSYRSAQTLPGDGMILMPGLVNGHGHSAMALFRGLADDLALQDWLTKYIFPAEGQFVNEEFVQVGEQLACWEMIRGGTTTFVDMYFKPDVAAEVVDRCGLRAIIAPSVIDFPSPGFTGWDDAFAAAVNFVQKWKGRNPRIIAALAPHAPYTVSPEHLTQAIEAARQLDVPLTIHVAETQTEVNDVKNRFGATPVQHLENLGFLEPRVFAAHMVWPNQQEISLLVQHGVGVIHNPTSNLKLASGISPIPAMLQAGVKVGLGTDGPASNNDLNMWQEMRLAALLHKGTTLDPTTVPATTALRMATLGGAEAIGLANQVGAITVGRQADLIQVRLGEPNEIPLYNVISQLVYAINSQDVDTVVVDGRVLMQNGKVLTIDIDRTRREVARIARQIKAQLQPPSQ